MSGLRAELFSLFRKRDSGKTGQTEEMAMGTVALPVPGTPTTVTLPAPTPATPETPAPVQPTWEQAVEQATADAAQVAALYSPVIGNAIAAGLPAEALIFGLISTFAGIFKHHAATVTPPTPATPAT
jgi:hypothetical protein